MTTSSIPAKVWLAAMSIVVIWPTAFSVIKIGLEYFSPVGLATFRLLVAAIAMILYVIVRRFPLPRARDAITIAFCGISGVGLYAYLLNLAIETISAGEAAFLVAINPIFVVLMCRIFLGDHFGLKTLGGMAIAVAGVAMLTLDGINGVSLEIGILFALLSGFSFSVYLMLQKPLLDRYPVDMMGAYCSIFGGLFFLPFLPDVWHEFSFDLPFKAHATYLYLGLVSSAAGFLVWAYALSNLSRIQASTIVYLLPVSAALHAMWLVDEVMTLNAWLGGVLVIIGVIIVNIRVAARKKVTAD